MPSSSRRNLRKLLAASPLLADPRADTRAGRLLAEESLDAISRPDFLIRSPGDALFRDGFEG
jgi:hypothetical protein